MYHIYCTHVATFQISMKFSDNIYLYDYDFTYIVTVVISMIQYSYINELYLVNQWSPIIAVFLWCMFLVSIYIYVYY